MTPCAYHPDRPSVTTCTQCGAPVCQECIETVAGRPVCKQCVSAIRTRVAGQMYTAPPPTSPVGLLLGAIYGLIVGVVGAFVIAKVIQTAHIEIGYLNALVGFGVGYAVLFGARRGGITPAIIGGVIAFFSMMLSEYILCGLAVTAYAASQNIAFNGPVPLSLFAEYLRHLNFLDWIILAIGVYGGVRTPLRSRR